VGRLSRCAPARIALAHIAAAGILGILSGCACAQPRIPVIGYLQSAPNQNLGLFREGLRELGHIEGKSVVIELRAAEGRQDRLAPLVAELVALRPEVIVTDGGTPPVIAAMKATSHIPIVFMTVADPAGQGLVASLSRPGGNVTGTSVQHPEFAVKSLELFRQMLPGAKRIAVLSNGHNVSLPPIIHELQGAARLLELELPVVEVNSPQAFERAFADLAAVKPAGLLILRDAMFGSEVRRLAILAARAGLPTMYGDSALPAAGGLSSYGPNTGALIRRTAFLVDKVLKGARPSDLPVEQPAKFDFVINLSTAKALGLSLSPEILLRADQVIR
jgi:putative ABC transport system substrate-binding protein